MPGAKLDIYTRVKQASRIPCKKLKITEIKTKLITYASIREIEASVLSSIYREIT